MALGDLNTEFRGSRGGLFRLALVTSIYTLLTLGFYRFWARTRLRRYYWSSIRPGGQPLEYVGQPLEKLLGFLVAVVMMAFYIGIVNLILMYVSFSLFQGNAAAYVLSFLGVVPIIFFAQYRARRYVLARTRWRGIRFAVDPGAWGYAWRALVHWLITICSLGLLWPRMTFWLEKYRTDRTWFGQARFEQGGTWTMLFGAIKHVAVGGALVAAGGIAIALAGDAAPRAVPLLALAVVAGGIWLAYGVVYYNVECRRRLANEKRLGGMRLHAMPRAGRIFRHYAVGYLLIWLCLTGLLIPFGILVAVVMPQMVGIDLGATARAQPASPWVFGVIGAGIYFAFFIFWGVLQQVFVTFPNLRHYAETLTIAQATELAAIAQRDRDAASQAEGFADALDVGAAL